MRETLSGTCQTGFLAYRICNNRLLSDFHPRRGQNNCHHCRFHKYVAEQHCEGKIMLIIRPIHGDLTVLLNDTFYNRCDKSG